MTVPPSYKRSCTSSACPKGRNFPCPKNSLPFFHGALSDCFCFSYTAIGFPIIIHTFLRVCFAFGFFWGIVGNSEKIPVKNWDGISDSTFSFPCSLQ